MFLTFSLTTEYKWSLLKLKKNPTFQVCKGMDINMVEFAEMKKQLEEIIININEYEFMASNAKQINNSKDAHLYQYKANEFKELLNDIKRINKEYYIIKTKD